MSIRFIALGWMDVEESSYERVYAALRKEGKQGSKQAAMGGARVK